MKLHLGCGTNILKGYDNIDCTFRQEAQNKVAEMHDTRYIVADAIMLKAYARDSVDEILCYHLFEHLPRPNAYCPNAITALGIWFSLLKSGGRLIMEMPNFEQVVKEYVDGNLRRKDNIFGLNRFPGDTHQWGYGPVDIEKMLRYSGFVDIVVSEGTDYHVKFEPCMRVEARKP